VLALWRAGGRQTGRILEAAREAPASSPRVLSVTDGLVGALPNGFQHDVSRSALSRGLASFAAAREALLAWEPFDLGWVQVVGPAPRIAEGELVALEAHTGCFWSIIVNRVTEVVDSPTRFGFLYTTTAVHVEEGQERFVVDFNPANESVCYLIEAVSRPRHVLARLGYPFTRAMQHRFARDSHGRMMRLSRGRPVAASSL
jgi:uncharacterized protein (UPF0548 family)